MTNSVLPPIPNVTTESELKVYHSIQFLLYEQLELPALPKMSVNKVGNVSVVSIIINH